MIYRTTIRIVAMALSIMIAVGPVAAQQRPTPAPPTEAELAAAEAELAAAEAELAAAEAKARAAEAEARAAAAEARAAAAEAAAEETAEEAADIVREAEQLIDVESVQPVQVASFQPLPRRRSAGRTTAGVILLGLGSVLAYNVYDNYDTGRITDDEFTTGFTLGSTLVIVGLGLATVWSDVEDRRGVAVNVTPDGGVRVSKSFGW